MSTTQQDRFLGLNSGVAVKAAVKAATTANIVLSGAQTIDGVACVADDRVLVKNQTAGAANGIYAVSNGAWARDLDFDDDQEVAHGTLVLCHSGAVNGSSMFELTSADPITLDTTALTFATINTALSGVTAFGLSIIQAAIASTARAALGFIDPAAKGDLFTATAAAAQAILTVGSDGQILAAQAAQSKGLIWTDYVRPNLLLNGNWLLDQINEGSLYTVTGGGADVITVDGWSGSAPVAPGVFKVRRLADPDNAAKKCLEITCTTADVTIAAADAYYLHTAVEGYDSSLVLPGTAAGQSVTVIFSFKTNVTGVYGVSVANSGLNRSYVGIITVADANEHTYSLTIPMDTAGTWLYDNSIGLRLRVCLAAGTNFQKVASAWGADNMLTTAAQCNFMSVNTNTAYLKPIQLIPGSVALAFGPADIQRELARAQRQYFKTFAQGQAVATNVGANTGEHIWYNSSAGTTAQTSRQTLRFPVTMRATPTGIVYNTEAANNQVRDRSAPGDCTVSSWVQSTDSGFKALYTGNAGGAIGGIIAAHATANARLV